VGDAPDAPDPSRGLSRALGAAFGLAMVVGATIGGGILASAGTVATALPSARLFLVAWLLGGANALAGATAFAELGAMIPRSGGMYVFARRAFGDGAGFVVGFVDWINWSVASSALILLAGGYICDLFPALGRHVLGVGGGAFAVLAALQWAGVRAAARFQEVATAIKGAALVGLVVAALALPHDDLPAAMTAAPLVPHGLALVPAFATAMQGIVFSYDSYYAVVYCGEEVREPGRTIPRSIFRGLVVVIGLYLLVNVAFLSVVPAPRVAGDELVGATVARLVFGDRGDAIIRAILIVAVLGTVNAQILATPRIVLAMARDGLFPARAVRVSARGTPTIALIATLALVGGFLVTGSFDAVLSIDVFFIMGLYLTTFAALFMLRRREPTAPRPYRAWGYPVVPGIAFAFALALVVAMTLDAPITALAVVAAACPAVVVARRYMIR
jgi:APA family basic amino acid/polyamine antiporter